MTNTTAAQPLDLDSLCANLDKLSAAIMNLPCKMGRAIEMNGASAQVYKEGHRDARHAAIELVNEQVALFAQARAARLDTTASAELAPLPNTELAARLAEYANGGYSWDDYTKIMREASDAIHAIAKWNEDRAPVAAQQAAAVYPVPIDWRKVVADLTAMNQATAKRAAQIITYVCEEGLKLAAKAPAAQADALALIEAARMDIIDFLRASNDTDAASRVEEFMTADVIAKNIGAASPASTPEASQQAITGQCSTCTNLEGQLRVAVRQRDQALASQQAAAVAADHEEIAAICDAYESGIGHGLQHDGHKSGTAFADPSCAIAYEMGYAEGEERATAAAAVAAPSEKQAKLRALADRIDFEELWRGPAMDRHLLSDEQRDRLDAGVMLRRYGDLLGPGRWLLIPPTGSVQFGAGSLDKVYEMAKQEEERKALRATQQEGGR